jgi:DNA-binding IclR family transcriptional regulator
LVAFAPGDVGEGMIAGGLRARTPNTVTSPVRMRQELERIRGEGAGYDHGEFDVGLRCVAAPVTAPDGSVVSALSLTAPAERRPLVRLAPAVRHAAEQASRSLAGRLTGAGDQARGLR